MLMMSICRLLRQVVQGNAYDLTATFTTLQPHSRCSRTRKRAWCWRRCGPDSLPLPPLTWYAAAAATAQSSMIFRILHSFQEEPQNTD